MKLTWRRATGVAGAAMMALAVTASAREAEPKTKGEATVITRTIDPQLFVASGPNVRSFTKEVLVEAPVDQVYAVWTTAAGWARLYPAPSASHLDLAIGGRYEWLFDGTVGSNRCQVLSYLPNRMVSFSWNAPPSHPTTREKRTWVVVETSPEGPASTRVRLTHLGFGNGPQWEETYDYFDNAWDRVLARLQERLGPAEPSAS